MFGHRAGKGKSTAGYTISRSEGIRSILGDNPTVFVKIRAPSGRLLFKLTLTNEEWKKFIE